MPQVVFVFYSILCGGRETVPFGLDRNKQAVPGFPGTALQFQIGDALLKFKKVQSDFFAEFPIDLSRDDRDKHFAGRADLRPVEMPAEYLPFPVAGAHMQVTVKLAVHSIECPGERDDFKASLKMIGVVFLFLGIEHTDSEIVDCAERLNPSQFDFLPERNFPNLFQNLLTPVEPGDNGIAEPLILHAISSYNIPLRGVLLQTV
jgi:hypothetical protein